MNKIPLVSVVIPTHNRPQYLPRAVKSAFFAAPDGDVEIIVVPNGPDESWKQSLTPWTKDRRVIVSPIETAHGNVARNHGMALARGKYLRFLDDDDYLFALSAAQCEALDESNDDVSLGGVDLVDDEGSTFRQWIPVASADFVESMLRPTRITASLALLWRRQSLGNSIWDPIRAIGQDTAWSLCIARDQDLILHQFNLVIGAWIHHKGKRTSQLATPLQHNQLTTDILRDTIGGLKRRNAMTDERRIAAAEGLWRCIHNAFPLAPRYWSKAVGEAVALVPGSHPPDRLYSLPILRGVDPRLIEWSLTPQRLIRYHYRQWARATGRLPPW